MSKQALWELVQQWEEASQGMSTGSDWGPDVYAECAHELKRVLEKESNHAD